MKTAEEILKGLVFRAKNVNMAEPPGGTFIAYHEKEVLKAMEEYANQFKPVDLIELKDKFYKDCTKKDSLGCISINCSPTRVFEWFITNMGEINKIEEK